MGSNEPLKPKVIPLSGKLILSEDPVSIGENFQSLKNLRYTQDHVKGIGGMTKINTVVPTTHNVINSAHHFRKDQPSESHVLAQAFDSAGTASRILDNKAVVPAQGNFEATTVFTEAANSVTGYFSDAPNGNVAYCDGNVAAIWGGGDNRVARVINHDPSGAFSRDATEELTNNLTDAKNIAVLKNINSIQDFVLKTAPTGKSWRSVAWSPTLSIWVAVGGAGVGNRAMSSTDGNTWTARATPVDNLWTSVIWVGGAINLFVAVGSTGTLNRSMTSVDGVNWVIRTTPVDNQWTSLAYSPSLARIVSVAFTGTGNRVMSSTNGTTWTIGTSSTDNQWNDVVWSPARDLFVAVAQSGTLNRVMTSVDGLAWITRTTPIDNLWVSVTWSPELLLFVTVSTSGSGDRVMSSSDGIIWTQRQSASDAFWGVVEWIPELSLFVAADASGGALMVSLDGILWASESGLTATRGLAWSPSLRKLVAVSSTSGSNVVAVADEDKTLHILIGATRTLQGINITMQTVNSVVGSVAITKWNGSASVSVGVITDGTAIAGVPLAQSGRITFPSAEGSSEVEEEKGLVLYWYRLSIAAGISVGTSISHIQTDSAFQRVKDIWDGTLREEISFQVFKAGSFSENTENVFLDEYDSTNTATFSSIGGLLGRSLSTSLAPEYILAGFSRQMMAIEIHIIPEKHNTQLQIRKARVFYWDSIQWVELTVNDGTLGNGLTFGKSGVISWSPPSSELEFKRSINGGPELFMYRIEFNLTLSANVDVFFVAGIPAQKFIKGFSFPLLADNRLWLLDEVSDERNACIVTADSAPDVYNGTDTERFKFGNEQRLTAGAWIYQNIGAEVRSIKIITKQNETWIVEGTNPQNWIKYQLSDKIGCVAPATMKTFTLGDDQSQQVALFQGSRGIYLCDGRSIVPIHNDIRQLFDDRQGTSINLARAKDSVGVFDEEKREYHWLFSDGASTTHNRELVYDILRKRWFEIDRGTGNRLQYALNVSDTDGNNFLYGTIDTGFLLRLENGNDFIGTAIPHELQIGDIAIEGVLVQTQIRKVKLLQVSKSTTVNNVTVTHFGDASTSGTIVGTFDPTATGKRLSDVKRSHVLGPHVFHSLKATISTNNESIGFEPLVLAVYYKTIRQDINKGN